MFYTKDRSHSLQLLQAFLILRGIISIFEAWEVLEDVQAVVTVAGV